MSAVAAPNGNRGILRQVHLVRELRVTPPVEAPAEAVLRALADELRRDNDVLHVHPDHVEFYDDDPPAFLLEWRGGRHLPIVGGVVATDTDAPHGRLSLELWMSPALYLEPLILLALILVAPMLPTTKAVLGVILFGLAAIHYYEAWQAYRTRLVDAARRAAN
ncbi:MAG TPA: hypothetical protein VF771_13385 [Longimicrobiaceae bacterium]